jgi:trimeric autotransporter adhesin
MTDSDKTDATGKLSEVRGVTWEWRDDAPEDAKEQPGMGVIAQEVERVFPELVTTDAQGRKKVNYFGLIGPLIEAVKELDARLSTLEAQLAPRNKRT